MVTGEVHLIRSCVCWKAESVMLHHREKKKKKNEKYAHANQVQNQSRNKDGGAQELTSTQCKGECIFTLCQLFKGSIHLRMKNKKITLFSLPTALLIHLHCFGVSFEDIDCRDVCFLSSIMDQDGTGTDWQQTLLWIVSCKAYFLSTNLHPPHVSQEGNVHPLMVERRAN